MGEKGVILLTGFEPFGGSGVNPSILACRELEGKSFNGYKVVVEEIPLRFYEIRGIIESLVEKYEPVAVICTGQSGGPVVAIERVAINVGSARSPYNCGYKPVDEPLNEEGPVGYFTRLPFRDILAALKEAKIPATLSNSAGTYGCNQIFYHLMDYLAREGIGIPAGLIHVPRLPEQALDQRTPSMSLDLITEALQVVVDTISKGLS
ncbi:MAG: pyroglutamyl-peptidase I [Candidatus Bathyarchaeota archaeon]|nr:pyroglutamyl-peptidase I [Candidatus Bathyarchaeota archaeon]